MAPPVRPYTAAPGGSHIVFVPVDGRVVFAVCVVCVLACAAWFCVLVQRGVEADNE